MDLNVAVIAGGASPEAEVSRSSAAEVVEALRHRHSHVTLLELDEGLAGALADAEPEVVFPVLHGPPGEDGTVQGFLETLGYPYVGSDVHGSALGMDKYASKALFRAAGLPVLEELVVRSDDDLQEATAAIKARFGDAVVVKPSGQGSALGTTPLPSGGDVGRAIAGAMRFGGPVMIEPYAAGREITVGVLDLEGEPPATWPAIEIVTAADEWYDYRNRYTPGRSEHIVPATLPEKTHGELGRIALAGHRALGLRDLSRADFIVTSDNEIWLLEVNTLPGMTPTSLYPDGARAAGYDFESLVDALVRSAFRRAE
ncbi:MAG: D-alanine--D-alanine ligase [Gammaproteobacteria bacterium]|nr:D-alanine--D-alanine ligase [Gammaproteobacteria bacterium]